MDKLIIQNAIKESVKEITEIEMIDMNMNLLTPEQGVTVIDLVYIIDRIEKKLNKSITAIFETKDYNILTIEKMSDEIALL